MNSNPKNRSHGHTAVSSAVTWVSGLAAFICFVTGIVLIIKFSNFSQEGENPFRGPLEASYFASQIVLLGVVIGSALLAGRQISLLRQQIEREAQQEEKSAGFVRANLLLELDKRWEEPGVSEGRRATRTVWAYAKRQALEHADEIGGVSEKEQFLKCLTNVKTSIASELGPETGEFKLLGKQLDAIVLPAASQAEPNSNLDELAKPKKEAIAILETFQFWLGYKLLEKLGPWGSELPSDLVGLNHNDIKVLWGFCETVGYLVESHTLPAEEVDELFGPALITYFEISKFSILMKRENESEISQPLRLYENFEKFVSRLTYM